MFGLALFLPKAPVAAPGCWPERDMVKDPEQISDILEELQHYTHDVVLPVQLLTVDGNFQASAIRLTLDPTPARQYVRLRLAGGFTLEPHEEVTLVFCWHQSMYACNIEVLRLHSCSELSFSWPAVLVRGGGREYYRAHPPEPMAIQLQLAHTRLEGMLTDLSEGGLGLEVSLHSVLPLQRGQLLPASRLLLGELNAAIESVRICSLVNIEEKGVCRLGLEFYGMSETDSRAVRKVSLNWQKCAR